MNAIVKVDFHGDTVTAVREGDVILVAVKPIVERLGLDWNGQFQRIKRDEVLAEGMCVTHIPSPGGAQDTTCLPLNMLPGFLFGIDTSRIPDPDVRATALCYKRECHAVLFRHFFGPKDDPPEETDRDTLDQNLRYVKEVRITCGPKAARQLMTMLGLFTGDPENENKASKQSESLLPYIADFLDECTEPDSAGHVRPDELYRLYLRWATRNKAPHFTMAMFGRMLRGAGLQKRKSGTSIYMGIRIRFDIRKELGL